MEEETKVVTYSFEARVDAVLGAFFNLADACIQLNKFTEAVEALQSAGNLVLASNSQLIMYSGDINEAPPLSEDPDPLADLND